MLFAKYVSYPRPSYPSLSALFRPAVLVILLISVLCFPPLSLATETGYVASLATPQGTTPLGRAGAVFFDARQDEIYISDLGSNRVVLFNAQGGYEWEFSDPDHLYSATQLVVDSLGRIYGMGASQRGRVSVFDYDGTFLEEIALKGASGEALDHIEAMLINAQDRLVVLTSEPAVLRIYDLAGTMLSERELFADFSDKEKGMLMLGKPAIVNEMLVLPLPMFQMIARVTFDGKLVDMFGEPGGIERKLAFPIAAAGDGEGNMLILDKHRHVLVKYDANGKWVREFGGFGGAPGHFYHPTVLAAVERGECIVGQIFAGRVQRFRVSEDSETDGTAETLPDRDNKK